MTKGGVGYHTGSLVHGGPGSRGSLALYRFILIVGLVSTGFMYRRVGGGAEPAKLISSFWRPRDVREVLCRAR